MKQTSRLKHLAMPTKRFQYAELLRSALSPPSLNNHTFQHVLKERERQLSAIIQAFDGFVYVCDRANDRIQVFRKDGTFVKEAFVAPQTLGSGSVWGRGRLATQHERSASRRAGVLGGRPLGSGHAPDRVGRGGRGPPHVRDSQLRLT